MARTRMLRLPEVIERVGLARSTIYGMVARGEFPEPIKLTRAINGWPVAEVDAWLESRPRAELCRAGE